MSRLSYSYPHVGMATRSSAGMGTAGIAVGEFINGVMVVRIAGLSGTNSRLVPYWQVGHDGMLWGDLAKGITSTRLGLRVRATTARAGWPKDHF
jgi:hypothetical protein